MRIHLRALLLLPLLCAGGPVVVTSCGNGTGPSCVREGQSCAGLFDECCPDLYCADTQTGALCQKVRPASALWQFPQGGRATTRGEFGVEGAAVAVGPRADWAQGARDGGR